MGQASQAERQRKPSSPRKDEIIHIRASAETKAILNQAATLRGQKLSEFMLDSARNCAEETVLDQRAFFLRPKAHDEFLATLDAPARPDKKLRKAMRRKPAWQR